MRNSGLKLHDRCPIFEYLQVHYIIMNGKVLRNHENSNH